MKHPRGFTIAQEAFDCYRADLLDDIEGSSATESRLQRISERSRIISELMDDLSIDIKADEFKYCPDATPRERAMFSQLEYCRKCGLRHDPLLTCDEFKKGKWQNKEETP